MNENAQFVLDSTKELMENAISRMESELTKVRTGRANPSMIDDVRVDYYGVMSPISQVANINTPDGRTLTIQPWEKSMLEPIQKGIQAANLGFNPANNGTMIIINVPMLTEDRRKDLVKRVKKEAEEKKVALRNVRRDAKEHIEKLQKEKKISEDEQKRALDELQKLTDKYTQEIAKLEAAKEKEVMEV